MVTNPTRDGIALVLQIDTLADRNQVAHVDRKVLLVRGSLSENFLQSQNLF